MVIARHHLADKTSMNLRILILATADARGHLMRAQLLYHALMQHGVQVDVQTTSAAGQRFLAQFGIQAPIFSTEYFVEFDSQQNMLPAKTDQRIRRYVLLPQLMLKDLFKLRRLVKQYELVLNDSFHPALLTYGFLQMRHKNIVHIFGVSLKTALRNNFVGRANPVWARIFSEMVERTIQAGKAWIAHDFAFELNAPEAPTGLYLPTPVAVPTQPALVAQRSHIAVYLNPHFTDTAIAVAIENAVKNSALQASLIGEGFAARIGWQGVALDFIDLVCKSSVMVSAPGMAALSIAKLYAKPIVLIVTEQPEQLMNVKRAQSLGLQHAVVQWQNDGVAFAHALEAAIEHLQQTFTASTAQQQELAAQQRLTAWAQKLIALAQKK